MADQAVNADGETYHLRDYTPRQLSTVSLIRCLTLIEEGKAVDLKSAAINLMRSIKIVLAREEDRIVGIGVLKAYRHEYACSLSEHSGVMPPCHAPEIGYLTVAVPYRRHGIGHAILNALCADHETLFATTSDLTLQRALVKLGFKRVGQEWKGKRGDKISLWVRKSEGLAEQLPQDAEAPSGDI